MQAPSTGKQKLTDDFKRAGAEAVNTKVTSKKLRMRKLVIFICDSMNQKEVTVDEIHQMMCHRYPSKRKFVKAVKKSITEILDDDENFMELETKSHESARWVYNGLKNPDLQRPIHTLPPQVRTVYRTRCGTYRNVVSFNIDRDQANEKVKLINYEPIKLVTPVAMLMQQDESNSDIFVSIDGEGSVESDGEYENTSDFSIGNFLLKTQMKP